MNEPKIKIKLLNSSAKIPTRATCGSAGYDLYSTEFVKLRPFERKIIKTGICIQLPPNYYARIAPRSGLAIKNGIHVNGGVIDEDYTGEIGVILVNLNIIGSYMQPGHLESIIGSANDFSITPGMKIGQMIIEKYYPFEFQEVEQLDNTDRSSGGFGSTGA